MYRSYIKNGIIVIYTSAIEQIIAVRFIIINQLIHDFSSAKKRMVDWLILPVFPISLNNILDFAMRETEYFSQQHSQANFSLIS